MSAAWLRSVKRMTRSRRIGEHGMMIDSRSDGLLDHDLGRLRREYVAAYGAWTQVAEDKASTSAGLTLERRAALRRYRAAEAAYLTCLRMTPDRQPGK
jgi:hypothetical protein